MRTPLEILLSKGVDAGKFKTYDDYMNTVEAIRQAQIDAIEECAGIAGRVLKHEHQEPLLDEINDEIIQLKNQVR